MSSPRSLAAALLLEEAMHALVFYLVILENGLDLDLTVPLPSEVVFRPDSSMMCFQAFIHDDSVYEGNETLTINLHHSSPVPPVAAVITQNTMTILIVDDESTYATPTILHF